MAAVEIFLFVRGQRQPVSFWAKPDHPATITFGADGNPDRMTMEMILGTSVRMGFARSGA